MFNKSKSSKKTNGQSLFELMVAVSIVGVTLIVLTQLVTKAIASSNLSRNKTLATRYTQEALEWIRSERDRDWASFRTRATSGGRVYCFSSLSWNLGACGAAISNTPFTREARLVYTASTNIIEVTVTTRWSDISGVKETRATTVFGDWRAD